MESTKKVVQKTTASKAIRRVKVIKTTQKTLPDVSVKIVLHMSARVN